MARKRYNPPFANQGASTFNERYARGEIDKPGRSARFAIGPKPKLGSGLRMNFLRSKISFLFLNMKMHVF